MAIIIKSDAVQLNELLLTNLQKVLGMPHADVAIAAGIAVTTWYRLMKEPQRFTVQQLLNLSNGLHIPVRHFFYRQTTHLGNRDDYVVNLGYKNCYYDSDAVRRLIKESTKISWQDAADVTGIHAFRVKESLLAVYRLPVTRLITFCNAFNLNLFDYIIDPNALATTSETEVATTSLSLVPFDTEEKPKNISTCTVGNSNQATMR